MVNEFAEYARPPKLEKDAIRIDNLVDEVIELYEISKIINIQKDKNIPIIYADQNKLRQVIINLIENSQDALKDIEKPKIKEAPSNKAVIGRYILPKKIFTKLKNLKPSKGGEIHITDAIQLLINDKEKFIAHNFSGKYLDCGTMDGYINSSKEIAKL